jgi:virginiamycin B lyase
MFVRQLIAVILSAYALADLTACSSSSVGSVPSPGMAQPFAATQPAKRGKIKIYDDTFGDATPQAIAAGPDGSLWFTDSGNDAIGRITTQGNFTLQKSPGDEVSDGITAGPDGAMWFTTYNNIGRIATDGTVTLFPDSGGSLPHGITTGPDGALWFAESNGSVGRITTVGDVEHFPVAPSNAMLQGIVTGPDGKLWVTQYVIGGSRFSNKVIRVTTTGKSKSFTVGLGPDNICVGPDGALWFTEAASAALGRLTVNVGHRNRA